MAKIALYASEVGTGTTTLATSQINQDATLTLPPKTGTLATFEIEGEDVALVPHYSGKAGDYSLTDGVCSLGKATNRFSTAYFKTAPQTTSDARCKQDIAPIDDRVLDAWALVDFVQFRLTSDPEKMHFGVLAQDIITAFERQGLNAFNYGIVSNEGDTFSVCYEQCLVLECALMRQRLRSVM